MVNLACRAECDLLDLSDFRPLGVERQVFCQLDFRAVLVGDVSAGGCRPAGERPALSGEGVRRKGDFSSLFCGPAFQSQSRLSLQAAKQHSR